MQRRLLGQLVVFVVATVLAIRPGQARVGVATPAICGVGERDLIVAGSVTSVGPQKHVMRDFAGPTFDFVVTAVVLGPSDWTGRVLHFDDPSFYWPEALSLEVGEHFFLLVSRHYGEPDQEPLYGVFPADPAPYASSAGEASTRRILADAALSRLSREQRPFAQQWLLLHLMGSLQPRDVRRILPFLRSQDSRVHRLASLALLSISGDRRYLRYAERELDMFLRGQEGFDREQKKLSKASNRTLTERSQLLEDYWVVGSPCLSPEVSRKLYSLDRVLARALHDDHFILPIAENGGKSELPYLADFLQDPDLHVRATALRGVCRILNIPCTNYVVGSAEAVAAEPHEQAQVAAELRRLGIHARE
jgi:hypothetical protein